MMWSWEGVNIRTETRVANGMRNIHAKVADEIVAARPRSWVICDDAANELADLLELDIRDGRAVVRVYHCKWSSEDVPGHRVADLYEAIGQCLRSAKWFAPGLFWPELQRRLAERQSTRLLRGAHPQLDAHIAEGVAGTLTTEFDVVLVQPGLVLTDIENHPNCNTLLVSTSDWLKDQGAEFFVVGSALA